MAFRQEHIALEQFERLFAVNETPTSITTYNSGDSMTLLRRKDQAWITVLLERAPCVADNR